MPKTQPFDEYSEQYEDWFRRHQEVYQSELAAVRAFLPKGGNGLEVGAGSGRFAIPLGIKIGLEPSPAMAARAAERGLAMVQGKAESLPFGSRSFDFILMVTVICFLDDVAAAFREAFRVLKPRGALVIGFIDASSPLGRQYEAKKEQSLFYRQADFQTPGEVRQQMEKAGFSDFAFVQTVFSPEAKSAGAQGYRQGFGEGSFVVLRGRKPSRAGSPWH